MPKVYVVNNGGHDFSKADIFGPITFLSQGTVNKFKVTEMAREFSRLMADSSPEDYIIPNGPTNMSIIACALFALKHGHLNLLLWKLGKTNYEDHYERRSVALQQLLEGRL